ARSASSLAATFAAAGSARAGRGWTSSSSACSTWPIARSGTSETRSRRMLPPIRPRAKTALSWRYLALDHLLSTLLWSAILCRVVRRTYDYPCSALGAGDRIGAGGLSHWMFADLDRGHQSRSRPLLRPGDHHQRTEFECLRRHGSGHIPGR